MKVRTQIKLEQIARMRIAGIKDVRIAQILGLSTPGLARILTTPEYIDLEASLLEGHLSQMDEALAGRVKEMKQVYAVGVPAAIRTMLEGVTQRRDLKAALFAAKEILDRDPERTFVKAGDAKAASPNGVVVGSGSFDPASLQNTVTEADKVVDSLATSLSNITAKPGTA
jgi:hypothetical protein